MHDIFLSYASRDREAVRAINDALKARGVKTFFDRDHLAAGGAWVDELARAIEHSRAFALFTAGDELGRVQRREVQLAFLVHMKRSGAEQTWPLIPVLLDGGSPDAFAGFLELFTWVDGRGAEGGRAAAVERLVSALQPGRGARDADVPPAAARRAVCPYRGLHVFREEDAPWFFGREQFVERLGALVQQRPLAAVVGPSGSGKSSVVFAGLVPRLRRMVPPDATWEVVSFAPHRHPFQRLGTELARLWLPEEATVAQQVAEGTSVAAQLEQGTPLATFVEQALQRQRGVQRLLLVVDQFEELFTLAETPAEAPDSVTRRFVKMLMQALSSPRLALVLTLRADYYGRAIELDRDLSDALEQQQVTLGPMRPEEMRRAIEGPAALAGLTLQPGLVDLLLADAAGHSGNLPLLEFALAELWRLRGSDGQLTIANYRDGVRGLAGSVATRADQVLSQLPPAQVSAAKRVLPRLVRVASAVDEGADTRERLALDGLDSDERAVIDAFVQARLVVGGGGAAQGAPTAEVAHEALIRDWPTLRSWIDDDRRFLLWRQRLAPQIEQWEANQRSPDLLLRGRPAQEARQWRRQRAAALDARETAFVRASTAMRARTRAYVGLAAAALVVAAGAGAYWMHYLQTDRRQLDLLFATVPLEMAMNSSRRWDDRHSEVLHAWGRAAVAAGRLQELGGARRDHEVCLWAGAMAELQRRQRGQEAAQLLQQQRGTIASGLLNVQWVDCLLDIAAVDGGKAFLRETLGRSDNPDEGGATKLEEVLKWALLRLKLQVAVGDPVPGLTLQRLVAQLRAGPRDPWLGLESIGTLLRIGNDQALASWVPPAPAQVRSPGEARTQEQYRALELRTEIVHQLAALGKVEAARRWLDPAGEWLQPEDILRRQPIMLALAREGKFAEALEALREVERTRDGNVSTYLAPTVAELHANLAVLLIERGQLSQAQPLVQRARELIELHPDDERTSRGLAALAAAEAGLGRLKAARDYAERCTRPHARLRAYAGIVLAAYPWPATTAPPK